MTIYSLQIITTTGYPYYNLEIQDHPEGIPLYLRFYDFSNDSVDNKCDFSKKESFELTAGFVSAIFEFSKILDRKLEQLEFITLRNKIKFEGEVPEKKYSDKFNVLITCQTETFLSNNAVKMKIQMIYDWIIQNKVPLGPEKRIKPEEKERLIEILTDVKAKKRIEEKKDELSFTFNNFLDDMQIYGLEGICITSFDLSPIISFGIDFKSVGVLLRNLGNIPEVEAFKWKQRETIIGDIRKWVYIVNSGVGPSEESIFMPYYYILFTSPESFLGESPGILTTEINKILG